jgi:penicillin V acylase-like amidase (Ntn superfamily)
VGIVGDEASVNRVRILAVLAWCLLAAGATTIATESSDQPDDCSSFVLDNNGRHIFATNFDMDVNDPGMVFVHKRGVVKTGLNPSTTGAYARWTAKYASIAFSLLGNQHAWAGMNERGLTFSTMGLEETQNPQPDRRPPLDWLWPQYLLDTCETVDDVIATDLHVRTYTVDHYLVADNHGGIAVIEFLDGRMVATTRPNLCVAALTNSVYSDSCAMWEFMQSRNDYTGYGNSFERFCLAADRVEGFQGTSTYEAITFAFNTLLEIYRHQYRGYTRWSIVFDTQNLRAYFRTQSNREIRWVDLEEFDLRCGRPAMMLDINENLSGDVSDAFAPYDSNRTREFREAYYRRRATPYDPQEMQQLLDYVDSYPCIQTRRLTGRRANPARE